jgi:hypothetical protein
VSPGGFEQKRHVHEREARPELPLGEQPKRIPLPRGEVGNGEEVGGDHGVPRIGGTAVAELDPVSGEADAHGDVLVLGGAEHGRTREPSRLAHLSRRGGQGLFEELMQDLGEAARFLPAVENDGNGVGRFRGAQI